MSLPTPPSTSHKEKENRAPSSSTSSRAVSWVEEHQYYTLPTSPSHQPIILPTLPRSTPTKSILKRTAHVLPLVDEFKKEATPEPSDPLVDLHYLEGPIQRILTLDASLRDLVESWSILAARMRICVSGIEADASWPLFQPIRQQRDGIVNALVRDLSRVFIDPLAAAPGTEDLPREREETVLPSPKNSPKKKRGMSEEQVKFARDLCTLCHAVIKLLNVAFTLPAIYRIFTDDQLRLILTHVLAIPLANELPTPNARKTCALAIWLIQTQRLPEEILAPASVRIAYALRRGIDGELGKEGKKGSVNDGLKAIHDLCTTYPSIFVPAFVPLLSSMLVNLLAPTLVIRTQACHALGGFAYAAAHLPHSDLHTRISDIVVDHLKPAQPPVSSSGPMSPSKDPVLIRTLRTTLGTTDPKHVAQGPVWAWSVIASLVVLLGPSLYLNDRLVRSVTALFTLGMRHGKSSVRALGCLTWRCMIWAYFHAPPVEISEPTFDDSDEDGPEEEEDAMVNQSHSPETKARDHRYCLDAVWKVIQTVVDMGTGVTTIGALLSEQPTSAQDLKRALGMLRGMSKKGGPTCREALEAIARLVSLESAEWDAQKLLPPGLFRAIPGLLTAEYRLLPQTVKPLFEECTQLEDIRSLTKEEISTEWVFNSLVQVWHEGLLTLNLPWGCEFPSEVIDVWYGLIRAPMLVLHDDENGLIQHVERVIDIVIKLLKDDEIQLTKESDLDGEVATSPVKPTEDKDSSIPPVSRWNFGLKLFLARELLNVIKTLMAGSVLHSGMETLLLFLVQHEECLLDDIDLVDAVRFQWSSLCAETAFAGDIGDLEKFWCGRLPVRPRRSSSTWTPLVRRDVWRCFVEKWHELAGTREAAVILLGVPFMDINAWDMPGEDAEVWDNLLRAAVDKALDYGLDSVSVINDVAAIISSNHTPTLTISTRVADLLLSNLDIAEARQIPEDLMQFVNDTLVATYPPEPRNKIMSLWLLRSLTRVIDACPVELATGLLEQLQEGVGLWISDEYYAFTSEDYSMDVLPLYQTILLAVQAIPASVSLIESLAPIVESAFSGREDMRELTEQAFVEFWEATYASVPEPLWGWPERIQTCLHAVRASRLTKAAQEQDNTKFTSSNEGLLFAGAGGDDSEEEKEVSTTLLLAPSPVIAMREVTPPPATSDLSTCTATTPSSSPRALLSTPPRPNKPSGKVHFALSELSPATFAPAPTGEPVTPKRTPKSARRRSTENKENVAPLLFFASVAERMARSPAGSVLGKRSLEDSPEEKPAKRCKFELPLGTPPVFTSANPDENVLLAVGSSEPEPVVRSVYFAEEPTTPKSHARLPKTPHPKHAEPDSDAEDVVMRSPEIPYMARAVPVSEEASPSTPTPRKRKGVFLDAVVVPTFRAVRKLERQVNLQSALVEHFADAVSTSASASPAGPCRTLRRTRSMTRTMDKESVEVEAVPQTPSKKRKARVDQLQREAMSEASILSSPMRAIRDADIIGSDDSIMLATPRKSAPDMSSDDDPHVGQVIPIGVVSPILHRRMKLGSTDPPSSDDSNMSASPSREHVKRRIARLPSSRLAKSIPSKMCTLSASDRLGSDDEL